MRNENWTLSLDDQDLPVCFEEGTVLFMTHTWGYHEHGSMTQPVAVQICFEADTNIITGIQMLMDAYAATVHTPRFYFVEAISPVAGAFELQWGT